MSGDEHEEQQEPLTSWLAACDEGLAAGAGPRADQVTGVTPEAQARRQRGLAFLRLLRQVLPPKSGALAEASREGPSLLPKQGRAAEEPGPPPQVPGYEVLAELGRGGMGVVYRARHVQLDRLVALKMILAGSHAGAEARTRFKAEAEAVARLQHPNVVQIYDVGEHEGLPFLALEFCPGGSLADRLDGTPLPPPAAAALAETLAWGVHAAHQAGIIHRDLKPGNVLLGADGTPKITDFGLAKKLDESAGPTRPGAILGTPSYMAPEQAGATAVSQQAVAVSREVGPAADVYALGAILYELLTGRPPFKGATPMNTVLQVLTCEPVPLRLLVPKVPRDLETVCLKCLQKDPTRRYPSAQALADDLRRYQDGRPIQARPVGAAGKLWRWCRRNPGVASLTAAVAGAMLAGTCVSTYFAVRATYFASQADDRRQDAEYQEGLAHSEADRANEQSGLARANEKRANEKADLARANEERAYHRAYIADVRLAQHYWEKPQVAQVLKVLDNQLPERTGGRDLRGFEWYYWERLCHAELLILRGHEGLVHAVAVSPDGKRLASAGADGTVKLWDAATGQVLATLRGHTGRVLGVAFSPDGRQLASAANGGLDEQGRQTVRGEVKLWDVATGQEGRRLPGHAQPASAVAFSPDGKRLASAGNDKLVKVWDLATGREALTLTGHAAWVQSVAFSPDGTRLASSGIDQTVRVWDAQTGQELLCLRGHTAPVRGVAFSPDGTRLASGGLDQTVRVWGLKEGRQLFSIEGHDYLVSGVAFSPDGKRLASASADQTIKVWDAASGQELLTRKGHTHLVSAVAFTPDGRRLVSGSYDGTVRVWDGQEDQEKRTLQGHAAGVSAVAFAPDGTRLASASSDKTLKVWDVAEGRELFALRGHDLPVNSVAFSPDGRHLASSSGERETDAKAEEVRVWDAATGREAFRLPVQQYPVDSVTFSPDGKQLATASRYHDVKLWDAATGRELRSFGGRFGPGLAFRPPDGNQLAATVPGPGVVVWDLASGREVTRIRSPIDWLGTVAWSPDGTRLAAASHYAFAAVVWDMGTGQELCRLEGHKEGVAGLAFSPDGGRLASCSLDGTVMVWDVAGGQEVLTLHGHTHWVNGVAFSPDGRRLASAGEDATVRVWDATARPKPAPAGGP
jgi:WD40 repeat protein/serine/threonine protein kinase